MTSKKKESTTYKHIFKYTGLLGSVQMLSVLISMVRNKCAAWLVGTIGFGLYDLYGRTLELIGNATNFGISLSAVRRLSKLYDRNDEAGMTRYVKIIRTWSLLTGLLGMVLCLVLAPWLSRLTMGNAEHTVAYSWLSISILCSTVYGGELSILKGTRQLGKIAGISSICAIATLLITVPCYYFWRFDGVVPALIATTAATLLIHLHRSTRIFPYRITLRLVAAWREGNHLLRLGTAYVAAGIIASGAEMLVRVFISNIEGVAKVGLYAAGFTLTVSYARMVFVALDADYFPRLSSVVGQRDRANHLANKQIDVLVLLMAPFLICFALLLPVVVRVLYTEHFLCVIQMVLCSLFYMYFKAIYTPIAYFSLAKGDSVVYFVMETAYSIVFAACVMVGYRYGNLNGAGFGLVAANLFDLLALYAVYSRRYGFRFESLTLRHCFIQGALLMAGLLAAWQPVRIVKFPIGITLLVLSAFISWRLLTRKSNTQASQ